MPPMSYPPLDVLAIGNAIVDVIATTDEAFLGSEGLVNCSIRLIDADVATRLYGRMAAGRETSGGSAAHTEARPETRRIGIEFVSRGSFSGFPSHLNTNYIK